MTNILKRVQKACQQGRLLSALNSRAESFLYGLKFVIHDPASQLVTLHCPDYIEPTKDNDEKEIYLPSFFTMAGSIR